MKLLHMYNAFYDVCVLYNPETWIQVSTHLSVVRSIQLTHRRESRICLSCWSEFVLICRYIGNTEKPIHPQKLPCSPGSVDCRRLNQ